MEIRQVINMSQSSTTRKVKLRNTLVIIPISPESSNHVLVKHNIFFENRIIWHLAKRTALNAKKNNGTNIRKHLHAEIKISSFVCSFRRLPKTFFNLCLKSESVEIRRQAEISTDIFHGNFSLSKQFSSLSTTWFHFRYNVWCKL